MSNFKLTWRIGPKIYTDKTKWESFLRLIDRHNDLADEVAFYIVDDTFPELTPIEDKRKQAEFCATCFEQLRKRGCSVGINVWPTLPLYEVERKFFPDMPRMVDIDGNSLEGLACPVSEKFISYMCEKYSVFASAKPDFIWMDDDCRFTHMGGRYPCFCNDCVKGFQNGKFANRQALVSALALPENRDLRISWSSYGADRLARLCSALRAAVDETDPTIDIGLMTIGATHTTFSGGYINKCMKALRSQRGRPGHDFYNDRIPDKIMWKTLEVGRQILEYPHTACDIFWEEDSFPQGHLSKSFRTRRNETGLGLMAGCTGVAFNHLAMNDCLDLRLGREVEELHAHRPRWERFLEFSSGLGWSGMWPLYSWFMTAKAKPEYAWLKEKPLPENQNPDCDITKPEKIGPYGIPLTADRKNACATLISGKTITSLTEEEIKEVFSGNVYMDGSALEALEELGFGELAGVKIDPVSLPAKLCFMTDHAFCGEFAEHNYRIPPRKAHTLIPLDDSVEWLGYRKALFEEGDRCYISKYTNALGGKVIVNGFDAWEFTDNPCNLYLFSSMAEWFDAPIRLKWENPNAVSRVQPYIRTNGKRAAVMLLNASMDTTNPFEIVVKGSMTEAVLLAPDGSETALKSRREEENLCIEIPPIDCWDITYILAE